MGETGLAEDVLAPQQHDGIADDVVANVTLTGLYYKMRKVLGIEAPFMQEQYFTSNVNTETNQ
jgi:hypothetical protein